MIARTGFHTTLLIVTNYWAFKFSPPPFLPPTLSSLLSLSLPPLLSLFSHHIHDLEQISLISFGKEASLDAKARVGEILAHVISGGSVRSNEEEEEKKKKQ